KQKSDFIRASKCGAVNRRATTHVLERAIMNRRKESVLLLLEYGADIDHQDVGGSTAINSAALGRSYEVALLLLKQGADPTIKDSMGFGPADNVMEYGNAGAERRSSNLRAYHEFLEALRARGLITREPPYYE
ncbi:MAG: ankyrin repeat domain-containing protein, partial [Verrucomicrobiota bacterium]